MDFFLVKLLWSYGDTVYICVLKLLYVIFRSDISFTRYITLGMSSGWPDTTGDIYIPTSPCIAYNNVCEL
jgi:hypothetical protein